MDYSLLNEVLKVFEGLCVILIIVNVFALIGALVFFVVYCNNIDNRKLDELKKKIYEKGFKDGKLDK